MFLVAPGFRSSPFFFLCVCVCVFVFVFLLHSRVEGFFIGAMMNVGFFIAEKFLDVDLDYGAFVAAP